MPAVVRRGRVRRKGYTIDKLMLRTARGSLVPALYLKPARALAPPALYIHGLGKAAESGARGDLARLAREGHTVLAPDLSEMGELRSDPVKSSFLAYLLGRSLLGERLAEILTCARLLLNPEDMHPGRRRSARRRQRPELHLVGIGEAGVPVLHAAALEPLLFAQVTVRETLDSWEQLAGDEDTPLVSLAACVHGALRAYDLPDLIDLIPGGRLTVVDPVDAADRPLQQPPFSEQTTLSRLDPMEGT